MPISDADWLEANLDSTSGRARFPLIPIPGLPPEEIQLRWTGRTGRENMEQAFSFYSFIRSKCLLPESPTVLDFGGGWGRVARLFLRDTPPDRLWVADCMADSVNLLRSTNFPGRVAKNEPFPPLPPDVPRGTFDLVYAFSVFSHLSERAFLAWTTYLLSLMVRPGGYLVYTTRGRHHIEHVAGLQRSGAAGVLGGNLPDAASILTRYDAGEFQFYPAPGGGELTGDFYGEAFVPPDYLRLYHGAALLDFTEAVPLVDQAVVVVRAPFGP